MRSMKTMGSAVLAALVLTAAGAASASAASWDPPNTNQHASGVLTLTTNGGASVTCTFTSDVRSSGNDLSQTVNASGTAAPPTFSGCSNSLGLGSTAVTSSAAWNATATSTTAVDVTNGNAVIVIGGGICRITATGVSVGGNTWSNSTHTLTANSTVNFPISESGFCDGGTTGHMSGSIALPATTVIT